MSNEPWFTANGVRKHYGSVIALESADLDIRPGEVLALLGQNGAGKSTLVNILSGHVRPDEGELRFNGRPITSRELSGDRSPVAVVQQELSMVPTMSVGENVFLANRDLGAWFSARKAARRALPYLQMTGLGDIDPMMPAARLSVGEQQLVELARALARDAQILILDEPTAALSDHEIVRVLRVVDDLRTRGHSVVYISHRLEEIIQIADRAIVVRDGRTQPPIERHALKVSHIIESMLGRPLEDLYPTGVRVYGESEILRLDGVVTPGIDEPVSLSLRHGEILGLAGQLGSGASNLIEALAGARPVTAGTVVLDGTSVKSDRPADAQRMGIAYCSGDRKGDGLFGIRSVQENLSAPAITRCAKAGWISRSAERRLAAGLASSFGVDSSRMGSAIEKLSGGNQQKVALGKWAGIGPKLLLVNEPTRGVDVGARAEIYRYLRQLADAGLSIIFSSSDTDEVIGLSDTVATFYRGRLVRVQSSDLLDATTLAHELNASSQLTQA